MWLSRVAFGLVFVASPAVAEQCEEQVAAFAEMHDLKASPPEAAQMGATEPAPPATLESRGMSIAPLESSDGTGGTIGESSEGAETRSSDDFRPPTREEESLRAAEAPAAQAPMSEAQRRTRAETLLLGATSASRYGHGKQEPIHLQVGCLLYLGC